MIKWKHVIYVVLPLLLVTGTIGIHRYRRNQELARQHIQKQAGLVTVTLVSVEDHAFCESVPFTGTILAINRAELKAEELGRVTRVMVREGDRVSSGSVLSSQDEDDLKIAVQVAESHLALAKAQAQQAKSDNNRAQNLLTKHSVTHQYAQQCDTTYVAAMASLRAAESNLSLAKSHLRKSRIVAPFGGEIAQRFIQPGEMLTPGQMAFTMVDNRKLEIQADLPAVALTKLKVGMKASFRVSGFDRIFKATLTQIGSSIQRDGRTLQVRMEVINSGGDLKSGLFAEGEIISGGTITRPALPAEILTTVGRDADIFVAEQGVARYRRILVGDDQNGWRPIYGLEVGTKVVADGRNLAIDGTPIRVVADTVSELGK
jgi:membrane fusion protein (multidrug efflux system)